MYKESREVVTSYWDTWLNRHHTVLQSNYSTKNLICLSLLRRNIHL